MTHVLGIILVLVALIVHEAGHAITMMRRGVEIKRAGIGLPILAIELHPSFLPFPLTISPVLLGAYVEPTEKGQERLESLPYEDQAVCVGAGVITNLVFGGLLGSIFSTVILASPGHHHDRALIVLIVSIAITILPIVFMRHVCKLMPILGTLSLAATIYLVAQSLDNVAGPVGTARMAASATSWLDAVLIGSAISLSLALLNVIPLVPLDGGRVMVAFMKSRNLNLLSKVYPVATTLVVLGFFLFTIMLDVVRL